MFMKILKSPFSFQQLGCRIRSNKGPGTVGGMPSMGVSLRDPNPYLRVSEKTTENSERSQADSELNHRYWRYFEACFQKSCEKNNYGYTDEISTILNGYTYFSSWNVNFIMENYKQCWNGMYSSLMNDLLKHPQRSTCWITSITKLHQISNAQRHKFDTRKRIWAEIDFVNLSQVCLC